MALNDVDFIKLKQMTGSAYTRLLSSDVKTSYRQKLLDNVRVFEL